MASFRLSTSCDCLLGILNKTIREAMLASDCRVRLKWQKSASNEGKVGRWRRGLGRGLCSLFARPFVCACHNISTMLHFHTPTHQTGRANFPHPACGQSDSRFRPREVTRRYTQSDQSESLVQVVVREA